MNKNAIKSFAIDSRRKLMDDVAYRMSLVGITSEGISEPISVADGFETYNLGGTTNKIFGSDVKRRESLVREVQNKGFENVVEEVAYTWFNRIIAIRFMEVNDYLPTRTRVLSSETPGKIEPDIITESLDLDLNYTDEDKKDIVKLLDDNKLDELFRFLFIKQCNKLNEVLPGLFEKTDDYMELLIGISFTNREGVVRKLIDTIPEGDFNNQVEIIGWLYQFYNTELKDDTFNNLKKNFPKERIPSVTQLFTPDWIVRYMVENSLGRLWINGHSSIDIKSSWEYYVDNPKQDEDVQNNLDEIKEYYQKIKPEDIRIVDPCMGSGHILIYVFDVLMQIYISEGYSKNDAAISIVNNNLYGLDIDERAYQLAYFAVMMKARSYNNQILYKNLIPKLCSIKESNNLSDSFIDSLISENPAIKDDLNYLVNVFKNAKEYGSLLNVKSVNFDKLSLFKQDSKLDYFSEFDITLLNDLIFQAKLLSNKYEIVITNPPYLSNDKMDVNLKKFLNDNYFDSKANLFAVFIEKCQNMLKEYGYSSMITQHTFMFIYTYENLRNTFLDDTLVSLVHLGPHAFEEIGGEVVQTAAFVRQKYKLNNFNSIFIRLIDYNNHSLKIKEFFNKNNYFINSTNKFRYIPGNPMSYWATKDALQTFDKGVSLDGLSMFTGSQNITARNKKYLRFFWEINFKLSNKWVPYAKGGKFRKYYGNLIHVVDWSDEAKHFYKTNTTSNLLDEEYWFKEGITYTAVASKGTGFRYLPMGCIFDKGGPSLVEVSNLYYCMGFLNSNLVDEYLKILNPSMNIQVRDVKNLPIIIDDNYFEKINKLTIENVIISKNNWDSNEFSMDFAKHPFFNYDSSLKLKDIYELYLEDYENDFNKMKNNEEKINKIFNKIYRFSNDFDYRVDESKITLFEPNLKKDIKYFISYAIGCIFGRYSLDKEGLIFSGGEFILENYSKFIPDDDNIVPVLDTEYFEDDLTGRFVEFVKVCFGEKNLEENLNFIADALSKNNKSNKERIRDYLLKNFFKDHIKLYKKCPIYWQFDSGEQNAFKCLIYMHRYDPTIVARVRTDYLHKTQKAIEKKIEWCENIIISESPEKNKAEKLKSELNKQLDEIKEYDIILANIANKKIEIDLDDGVKVNYAKFKTEDGQSILKNF